MKPPPLPLPLRLFVAILALDAVASVVVLILCCCCCESYAASSYYFSSYCPPLQQQQQSKNDRLLLVYDCFFVVILMFLRICVTVTTLWRQYHSDSKKEQQKQDATAYKNKREELLSSLLRGEDHDDKEEEATSSLSTSLLPSVSFQRRQLYRWTRRYCRYREALPCEALSFAFLLMIGSIHYFHSDRTRCCSFQLQQHIIAPNMTSTLLLLTATCSAVEGFYMNRMIQLINKWNQQKQQQQQQQELNHHHHHEISHKRNISLEEPLLTRGLEDETHYYDQQQQYTATATAAGDDRSSSSTSYKATWSDLIMIGAPDKHLIALACIFLLAAAIANVYIPKFTGDVLDALVAHQQQQQQKQFHISSLMSNHVTIQSPSSFVSGILQTPGFVSNMQKLVIVSILASVFGGLRGAIFILVGARVTVRLRVLLMDALLCQDMTFFDTTRIGDLTSRLGSDTTLAGASTTTSVNVFLRSTVRVIGTLIFMFTISWQLTLFAFITVPAVTVLSKWYGRYLRRLSKAQQTQLAEGNAVSESSLCAMTTVRAFGAERQELHEFQLLMQKYLKLNDKTALATVGYSSCIHVLPQLAKALVLFYGGLLTLTDGPNRITGGQLVSFILYFTSLSDAFNSLGGIYASLIRAVGAADKVLDLVHRTPNRIEASHADPLRMKHALAEQTNNHLLPGVHATKVIATRTRGLYPEACIGRIKFTGVYFRYPSRPEHLVLNKMNLDIPAGSVAAIVGVSGSGKSSVLHLLLGLYEPCMGQVSIDGVSVQELCPDWLSRHVAVVSQEPSLFARSIRRNILYGLEDSTQGTDTLQVDIEMAAKLANAASFIEEFPFGYETPVGERGQALSAGQKQRIAIARALVRKPRILLLDEASSALDSESEHIVQVAIDDMIRGQRSLSDRGGTSTSTTTSSMTVVIVAHRLSTVRNADCIFVLDEGRIVEQGRHEELMSIPDGVYSGLVHRQLGLGEESSGSLCDLCQRPF